MSPRGRCEPGHGGTRRNRTPETAGRSMSPSRGASSVEMPSPVRVPSSARPAGGRKCHPAKSDRCPANRLALCAIDRGSWSRRRPSGESGSSRSDASQRRQVHASDAPRGRTTKAPPGLRRARRVRGRGASMGSSEPSGARRPYEEIHALPPSRPALLTRERPDLGVLLPLVCCGEAEAGHRCSHPLSRLARVPHGAGSELARALDIPLASSCFGRSVVEFAWEG
jgi:hypothetical protein